MTDPQLQRPLVAWFAQTIDCHEPNAMADFYVAALGGRVAKREADCTSVEAGGLLLNFRAVPAYRPPTWPSADVPMQQHFEWVVEDLEGAAEQLVKLGASVAEHQNPDDPHLLVMLDPAGHPLCIIRSSAAARY